MTTIKIEDLPILEELDQKKSKGIFGSGKTIMEPTISRSTFSFNSYSFESSDLNSKIYGIEPPAPPQW